jgi:hypothetical protein
MGLVAVFQKRLGNVVLHVMAVVNPVGVTQA